MKALVLRVYDEPSVMMLATLIAWQSTFGWLEKKHLQQVGMSNNKSANIL